MPRIRQIKPEFFDDPDIGELTPLARLFFIGLWTQADRDGRLLDDTRRLKARIFPYDNVDIEALAVELHGKNMIRRYQDAEKHGYIWIRNFTKHQHPHPKEPQSLIPEYQPDAVEKHGEPCKETASPSESGSLGSGSLGSGSLEYGKHGQAVENHGEPEFHLDEAFEQLRDDYPPGRRQDSMLIRQDFMHAFDGRENGQREALYAEMRASLTQHKRSAQWQEIKHIPMLGKWISEHRWIQCLPEAGPMGQSSKTAGNQAALERFVARRRGVT